MIRNAHRGYFCVVRLPTNNLVFSSTKLFFLIFLK